MIASSTNTRTGMNNQKIPGENPYTIILVDDDLDDLALSERVLKNASEFDEIICLNSGKALFSELESRHVFKDWVNSPNQNTLIMLDIHMPDEDGISLLTQLRTSPYTEDIPIIMLTEDCGTDNVMKTYDMSADGYFTKPLREEHLHRIKSIFKTPE